MRRAQYLMPLPPAHKTTAPYDYKSINSIPPCLLWANRFACTAHGPRGDSSSGLLYRRWWRNDQGTAHVRDTHLLGPVKRPSGKASMCWAIPTHPVDRVLKNLITLIYACVDRLCTCVWGSEETWRSWFSLFTMCVSGIWLRLGGSKHFTHLCVGWLLTLLVSGDRLIFSSSPSFKVSNPKPPTRLALPGDLSYPKGVYKGS